MLKKDGCFSNYNLILIRVHKVPIDCTRWTEDGLKYFLNECRFNLDKTSEQNSWGNKKCKIRLKRR